MAFGFGFGFKIGGGGGGGGSGSGGGPTLYLDFLQGVLNNPELSQNTVSFTRSSNATYFNSDGVLMNAPNNLLTFSEQFDNAAWVKGTSVAVAANSVAAPDDTTTADTIAASGSTIAANFLRNTPNLTVSAGDTYVFSIWLRADSNVQVTLRVANAADADGVIETVNVGTTWQRFTIARTFTTSSTAVRCVLNYTNTTVPTYYAWGAQLNVGALQPYNSTTVKNLLGFSQEFDNAAWSKGDATVTANTTVAPDGSITADTITFATNSTVPSQTATLTGDTPYTISFYVHANSTAPFVRVRASTAAGSVSAFYNVTTGVFGSMNAGFSPGDSLNVGGGWRRVSVRYLPLTADGGSRSIAISATVADNSSTAAAGGTLILWGAQLSDSASLDPYVYNPVAAPASTAYYGPRFDYSPSTLAPLGLLIEEQRTNSIRNNMMVGAVAGTPGTLPTNWSATGGGLTQTVIGTGVENGIAYVDFRLNGTTSATSAGIRFEPNTGVAVASGQTWAASTFCRLVGGSTANVTSCSLGVSGLTVGAVATTDSQSSSLLGVLSMTNISTTRTTRAITFADVTTAFARVQIIVGFTVGASIDITLRIGMPQLEQGAFATSVIPTSGATATRAADVATMIGANFSNWYNQAEGTLYAESSTFASGTAYIASVVSADDGTGGNRLAIRRTPTNSVNFRAVSSAGSIDASALPWVNVNKSAFGYKANSYAGSSNGGLDSTIPGISLTNTPTNTQLQIGNSAAASPLCGHIRRIAYYPRRLSNAELQAVTA